MSEVKIDNVVFKEAVNIRGLMPTNFKQGMENARVYEDKGGVVVDLPATDQKPRCMVKIPYSNIRSIVFETK